jgi:hypothetical protein
MKKLGKVNKYIVIGGATLIVGSALYLVQYWVPILFPWAIAYLVISPVYKIWEELEL